MTQNLCPKMTVTELNDLLCATFPQAFNHDKAFDITEIFAGGAVLQLNPNESHLRHGGTVSGPAMFALADIAGYVAILAHVGHATATVTSAMNINFLAKPDFVPLYARSTILRLGRQIVVTQTTIHARRDNTLLAHATASYSMPPAKK